MVLRRGLYTINSFIFGNKKYYEQKIEFLYITV